MLFLILFGHFKTYLLKKQSLKFEEFEEVPMNCWGENKPTNGNKINLYFRREWGTNLLAPFFVCQHLYLFSH